MKKDLTKRILIITLIFAVVFSQGFYVFADGNVLKKGDNSDEVKEVQVMLKSLGYFKEECTGYFGEITEKAVIAFQKDYKLGADGVVGPATLKKLKSLTSSNRSSSASKNNSKVHTVKSGDTIWDIAKAYGVTRDAILKANNLNENSVLQIGDKLIIPVANSNGDTNDETNNNTDTYKVKQGDCLSSIAEDFGVSLASLLKANNLTKDSVLQIGQVLKIPNDDNDTNTAASSSTNTTETNSNNTNTTPTVQAPVAETKTAAAEGKGEYLDWFEEVRYIFERGDVATVTDVETGKTFKVYRYQGGNHADVEPMTAEDTAVMKSLYGSWSWDRRAIIVTIDGRNIAASMNGMPHGNGSIDDNNFEGHFCIHFKNSKTHAGNKVDKTHQAMVKKAAGM